MNNIALMTLELFLLWEIKIFLFTHFNVSFKIKNKECLELDQAIEVLHNLILFVRTSHGLLVEELFRG